VAWSPHFGGAAVDPDVRRVAESAAFAFELLGCDVEEANPTIDDPYPMWIPIVLADQYAWSGHLLEEHAEELTPEVRLLLESACQVPGYVYSKALRAMERFRMQMADFFERYDLLLSPTNPVPASLLGD
jgi:aspartyl-tRNA(Asn)/glutamyl-tRNA(Gln) amidotransferase subunit A